MEREEIEYSILLKIEKTQHIEDAEMCEMQADMCCDDDICERCGGGLVLEKDEFGFHVGFRCVDCGALCDERGEVKEDE